MSEHVADISVWVHMQWVLLALLGINEPRLLSRIHQLIVVYFATLQEASPSCWQTYRLELLEMSSLKYYITNKPDRRVR